MSKPSWTNSILAMSQLLNAGSYKANIAKGSTGFVLVPVIKKPQQPKTSKNRQGKHNIKDNIKENQQK